MLPEYFNNWIAETSILTNKMEVNMVTTASRVTIVRDGDSFHSSPEGEVRLLSVCAPEKNRPGYALAKRHLEALILSRTVTLQHNNIRDTYGRLLADVYVDRVHVNARMRALGYTC